MAFCRRCLASEGLSELAHELARAASGEAMNEAADGAGQTRPKAASGDPLAVAFDQLLVDVRLLEKGLERFRAELKEQRERLLERLAG